MENTYLIIKIGHIIAGAFALLSGLMAILLRKNTKLHRPVGKIYFWCMTIIFLTSIPMALFKFNPFLLFISIFTYHASATAYRSLKLKKLHQGQKPLLIDWGIEVLNISANLVFVTFGACYLFEPQWQYGIISIVFGLIGLRNSQTNLLRLLGKAKQKNHWLIAHIGGMLGSYIGAITAFTVNNNRWIGMPDLLAWLGPTVILVPFIVYETAKFKRTTPINL